MFTDAYTPDKADSVTLMLERANLDWRIQRATPAIRPLGFAPGKSDPADFDIQNSYRFLRRSDTGKVFGCVSKKYRPHQNAEIIESLDTAAKTIGTHISQLGSLRGGAWVFAQVALGQSFKLGWQDYVEGLLTITTKHDGTGSTRGGGSSVCIVCENTFMMASRDMRGVISHKSDLGANTAVLENALKTAAVDFGHYKAQALKLSASPIKSDTSLLDWLQRLTEPVMAAERDAIIMGAAPQIPDGAGALDAILAAQEERAASVAITENMLNRQGRGIMESILEGKGQQDPARKGTWWGAVNGVTHYTNWTAQSRNADNRTASTLAGPNADLNRRALELALVVSGNAPTAPAHSRAA